MKPKAGEASSGPQLLRRVVVAPISVVHSHQIKPPQALHTSLS